MGTTKIWAIKDSLSRVVDYAFNPQKTIFSDLEQTLLYAGNEEKTIDKNEKMMYVTGVNCRRNTAYKEMRFTQVRFGKTTGNVAYHAYQSFKTGEVTPELAHKIGVELANKMWSEYQVLVATHFNTGTYHNHFVVCSVNMFTGKKFNCNKKAYYKFRDLSDELCEKYNLTVIKNPKGKTPRSIYFAEKRGEPTKYNLMRKAIDEAMESCINFGQFKKIMYAKGYVINDNPNRKYPTIRSINDKKATRMYQLGEGYTPNKIAEVIKNNPYERQNIYLRIVKAKKPKYHKKVKYKGSFENMSNVSVLGAIFIVLLYLMGVRIAKKEDHKKYQSLSPEMKRASRKLEMYSEQVRLICSENLNTIDDVKNYIDTTNIEINKIIDIRQKYRNKLRHCTDENEIKEFKAKRDECTYLIGKYRKMLKIANRVIQDVPEVKELIRIEKEYKYGNIQQEKNKKKYREAR